MNEQYSSRSPQSYRDAFAAGQILGIVEQLQAELDTLRQQLAWSNRLGQLGMLTAALAHETNNFLTPVRSYAQLALANPDDAVMAQRALRAAVDGTAKASELADRVMGIASPTALIETGVCLASEAAESAMASMLPLIKQQGVDALVRVAPVKVKIDGLALEQVLINLIGNACQAMSDRASRREVVVESSQVDGPFQLCVHDTGPGVPLEVREDLFGAFVTCKAKGPTPGTGLGLNICKQLIESAGGQIMLASSSDQGSSFQITLPTIEEPV